MNGVEGAQAVDLDCHRMVRLGAGLHPVIVWPSGGALCCLEGIAQLLGGVEACRGDGALLVPDLQHVHTARALDAVGVADLACDRIGVNGRLSDKPVTVGRPCSAVVPLGNGYGRDGGR